MTWWMWLLLAVGSLAGLVALVALVGSLLPKEHVAACQARLGQPPESVWEALTNVEAFPSWRPDVRRVERLPDRDGRPVWREIGSHGSIVFEQVSAERPHRLSGRIADPSLPFGGGWTYEIVAVEGASLVTITENGEIYNPVFRFLARFVFGYHATLEWYLRALGRKFGEDVTVQRVN